MNLYILLIILALLSSAYISASETALLAVNKIRIRHLASNRNNSASRILGFSADPERFFGTILLINNIANISLSALVTSVAIQLGGNTGGVIAAATIGTTALLVLFGELTPKTLAAVFSERVALAVSGPVALLMKISWPFVWIFTLLPRGLLHLMGRLEQSQAPAVTQGELRMLIDVGEAEGTVEKTQGAFLENVFRFAETEVREVMTPRTDILWVQADTTLMEFLADYRDRPHTRYPVYDDDFDDVVGILSVKDVLVAISSGDSAQPIPVSKLAREALFVPETKHLDDLFKMMQETGSKIALVIDEFGGVAGLVTMNRVLEQIVGHTGEEGQVREQRFVALDENTYDLDGGMSIAEANDALGLNLPSGEYETVAGFILERLQRIPAAGDRVRLGDLRLQVLELEGNRISRVRARRRARMAEQSAAAD